jgi:hypothetical protein
MTIPPRTNKQSLGQLAPLMNSVVRGLAQGRQVLLVDYYREMQKLPEFGLSTDGVHPNVATGKKACDLTEDGLQFGYNLRNALSLQSLDRVRRLVEGSVLDWDDAPAVVIGDGSPDDPYLIDALPFTHMDNTSLSPHALIDTYTGCDAAQDESGPEWVYALSLSEPTALRLAVLTAGEADVDIHLLGPGGGGADCIKRHHTLIQGTLPAGDYRVALDSFVSNDQVLAGEYLLVVVACETGDARCQTPIVKAGD